MAKKLVEIEGIGVAYAAKLESAGVTSVEDLLEKCRSPQGRKQVAASSGLSNKLVLRWTNMADLFRVEGVGEEFADLLEAAGVDTVPELAQRNAKNLQEKMAAVNADKKLTRQVPAESQVDRWIEQAKALERIVTY